MATGPHGVRRRSLLRAALLLAAAGGSTVGRELPARGESRGAHDPAVAPGRSLVFPRDHGAHPAYRGEWWYVTGWLRRLRDATPLGFQVTFFRVRLSGQTDNPSRFTPSELVIAHAALADPKRGRLRIDQRIARAGFGLAYAGPGATSVRLDDWSLVASPAASPASAAPSGPRQQAGAPGPEARSARDGYRAVIVARDFDLRLELGADGPPLLHGDSGFSRKSPREGLASYYYSRPRLQVRGEAGLGAAAEPVAGSAWLDHEWWNTFLDEESVGWDWVGANLADGGALMAMRIRDRNGATRWTAATLDTAGVARRFGGTDVSFVPVRRWRSPRTGAEYPVEVALRVGAEAWSVVPLFDDQELDSRSTTGAVYWEGAVRLLREGREAGRGYLEMTGYLAPMRF